MSSAAIVRLAIRDVTLAALLWCIATPASAQTIAGVVRDQTSTALPGVIVELLGPAHIPVISVTDRSGSYHLDAPIPGRYTLTFSAVNFAPLTRRDVDVRPALTTVVDVMLHLALSADVTVTGKATFTNLADADRPTENLVGIAQSASQGAVTARQLDVRPMMRVGDVLEVVPGAAVSQHSGEGKANQYYLRGFNLDHGTDFATTVAGMPVNLPTHAHGQGYSDLSFLIPELVSGVQFSKGPYFADQGDFATAGAATISYANVLSAPIVRASGGHGRYGRAVAAASRPFARGHFLGAFEVEHNDGPWDRPDDYRKVNGVARFSAGDSVNGVSLTAMAYRGRWNASDQIPKRAVADGLVSRFGTIDLTDGGEGYRYSGALEWQRTRGAAATTKVVAYGIASDLQLFSNFTFFLNDVERGDQFAQVDHRFVSGAKVTHRRIARWGRQAVQNMFGAQLRHDDISRVGLYHTRARERVGTIAEHSVLQTSGALFIQNEVQWTSRLRSVAGLRGDLYRFGVHAVGSNEDGSIYAGMVTPKGGVILGLSGHTELYANAGVGFHSNDARLAINPAGATDQAPISRVTPLVRARGAELGVRTIAIPHLQSTVAAWTLSLDSELVFVGDAGTTTARPRSRRVGLEWTNYWAPTAWLTLDADVSLSRGRFTDRNVAGDRIPGAVGRIVSAGVTVDAIRNVFGGVRLRHLGPRALTEDNAVRSEATTLVNGEIGYAFSRALRLVISVFNVLDTKVSDIEYYYTSRLPGEPAGGVDDVHLHPTIPRTARASVILRF